jgi:hypothetical protein
MPRARSLLVWLMRHVHLVEDELTKWLARNGTNSSPAYDLTDAVADRGTVSAPAPSGTSDRTTEDDSRQQVRQLVKQALEAPTAEQFTAFFDFTLRFRRLSVWNARMAHIQRPGATAIASEAEWRSVGRQVLPDAVPIIILWPFAMFGNLATRRPRSTGTKLAIPSQPEAYLTISFSAIWSQTSLSKRTSG